MVPTISTRRLLNWMIKDMKYLVGYLKDPLSCKCIKPNRGVQALKLVIFSKQEPSIRSCEVRRIYPVSIAIEAGAQFLAIR
jgi:hypothetical protein